MSTTWVWADLSPEKLALMTEAERLLGADILLAYKPAAGPVDSPIEPFIESLEIAPLSESQLECLHGLEAQLQAVVIAYKPSEE